MVVFGRSVPVEIIHAPGTPEEKRWTALMGGDLASKALFQPNDRVKTGDDIHSEIFDEPRIISSVNPVTALAGNITHWEARMVPMSQWQRETGYLPRRRVSQVRIFISHSSEDREVATRFANLLRMALPLPSSSIRRTSVEAHGLPGGADTAAQLKEEIRDAKPA